MYSLEIFKGTLGFGTPVIDPASKTIYVVTKTKPWDDDTAECASSGCTL